MVKDENHVVTIPTTLQLSRPTTLHLIDTA
jgi:hypothetical protein